MGMYNSTYIGIYIEVDNFKVDVTSTVKVHPDTGKIQKEKNRNKFCPQTGKKYITKEITKQETIYPNPYIEDVEGLREDVFFSPAYQGNPNGSTFIISSTDSEFAEYNDNDMFNLGFTMDVKILIEEFKAAYEPYLAHFRELYGDLRICYGVVSYAH